MPLPEMVMVYGFGVGVVGGPEEPPPPHETQTATSAPIRARSPARVSTMGPILAVCGALPAEAGICEDASSVASAFLLWLPPLGGRLWLSPILPAKAGSHERTESRKPRTHGQPEATNARTAGSHDAGFHRIVIVPLR